MEWHKDGYRISTDPGQLDRAAIHRFLSEEAYWSLGMPRALLETALDHSLCFGLYHQDSGQQVGFARLITDCATFAYLADVYVLAEHRGQGLATWMMQCLMSHPQVVPLRRIMLVTKDAHALYRNVGFEAPADPGRILTRHRLNAYQR